MSDIETNTEQLEAKLTEWINDHCDSFRCVYDYEQVVEIE